MTIQEITSRVLLIRGTGTLHVAYGDDGTSAEVQNGRCLYLVRLELATEGHPEINADKFALHVRTTKDGITYSKGLGGSRRGWQGKEIPFEQFTGSAQFPHERTDKSVDTLVGNELADILRGFHYNCNFNIYSEFEGYRDGFGPRFDVRRTYLPIIGSAIREVQPHLR